MRWLISTLCAVGFAQLPPPNEAGAAMGHLHLNVRDMEANRKFWMALGAAPVKLGTMEAFKLPDVLVFLRQAEPSGGSEGSVVGHVGLKVRDLAASLAKWKSAGLRTAPGASTRQAFVFSPDDLKIEMTEDPSMQAPIANHHIHFYVAQAGGVAQIQSWYVKMFGAKAGKRARFEAADIPGVNLTFSESPAATVATKGRVLDHIGFEIKDLERFCKKLEAQGVKFDVAYRQVPALGISLAFLTDPWGTYIELTEGLNRL